MNFSIAVICLKEDGTEDRHDVLTVTKEQLVMETLGLTVAEGKALLAGVQAVVVDEQATAFLKQHRDCETCGKPHRSKDPRQSTVNTVFGPVAVPNPRWHRCVCRNTGLLLRAPHEFHTLSPSPWHEKFVEVEEVAPRGHDM